MPSPGKCLAVAASATRYASAAERGESAGLIVFSSDRGGPWRIWCVEPDGSNLIWALMFFALGFIGAEYALIFTNAQLPTLGTPQEIGKISGSGFAFGYLGVFLLLHFGTDLSASLVCGIALLIGDAPGAMLAAIIIGSLLLVRKPEEHPESTVQNPPERKPETSHRRAANKMDR